MLQMLRVKKVFSRRTQETVTGINNVYGVYSKQKLAVQAYIGMRYFKILKLKTKFKKKFYNWIYIIFTAKK